MDPLPEIVVKHTRQMLGKGRVADENTILQTALAVQQIHDPDGPKGDEFLNLHRFCAEQTGPLLQRILAADKEIQRLRSLLDAKTKNGDN